MLPAFLNANWLMRALLPVSTYDWIADILGVSASMDSFKGRGASWALGSK